MEDKREEQRIKQKDGEQRMANQKLKEQRWALMKESMKVLKENDYKWQERRIKECERIRSEEKKDRLAVVGT